VGDATGNAGVSVDVGVGGSDVDVRVGVVGTGGSVRIGVFVNVGVRVALGVFVAVGVRVTLGVFVAVGTSARAGAVSEATDLKAFPLDNESARAATLIPATVSQNGLRKIFGSLAFKESF
jgi:hypothetical protein